MRCGTATTVFVVSLIVTAILYALPQLRVLAYPLLLISTLVHEWVMDSPRFSLVVGS